MKTKVILSMLLCFFIHMGPFAMASMPTQRPIKVTLSEEAMAKLDPERREMVEQVAKLIESQVRTWKDFPITLPHSEFGTVEVTPNDFIKAPDSSEVQQLAFNQDGSQKKLTSEQMISIKQKGLFVVESKQYPGQFHVWKLSLLLQKGHEDIDLTYKEGMGNAAGHFIVRIPEQLWGDKFSVKKGLKNIYIGIRGVFSTIVGLSETVPMYSQSQVKDMVEKEKDQYMLQFVDSQYDINEEVNFDDRLYKEDEDSKKYIAILSDIKSEHRSYWNRNESDRRYELRAELGEKHQSNDELESAIQKAIDTEMNNHLDHLILTNENLEEQFPGLGQTLVNRNKALRIIFDKEQELNKAVTAKRAEIEAELWNTNPYKSHISDWKNKQVEQKKQAWYQENRWTYYNEIPQLLKDQGLFQEAFIFTKNLEFMMQQEDELVRNLEGQKKAAKIYTVEKRIWHAKNWELKEAKDHEGNTLYFYPEKYRKTEVASNQFGWRIRNFVHRAAAYFKGGLHGLLVTNFWNGPAGIKSQFKKDPYFAEQRINDKTGQLENDPDSLTYTYASRLKGIWQDVKESRRKFEEAPNTGFLGKTFTRPFHKFWNYVIKGVGGSALVAIGQPILTVCNTAVCGVGTVTSVVWAPLTSLAQTSFNAVIYDTDSPYSENSRRWFPLVGHLLMDTGVYGALQATAGGVGALVVHPAMGAVRGTTHFLRKHIRTGYDNAVRKLIIKNRGKVPDHDTFLAKRVQGPGLSSNHFYQIPSDLALVFLRAALEEEELGMFREFNTDLLHDPRRNLEELLQDVFGSFSMVSGYDDQFDEQIDQPETRFKKELDQKVSEREQELNKIRRLPVNASKIKLTQDELDLALEKGTAMVQEFFEQRILPAASDKMMISFWNRVKLRNGDWASLTKHYYSKVFSSEFIVPLEETDVDFIIHPDEESLHKFLKDLSTGFNN